MPVNPELLGREFPPTEPYLVGREKVREFARAVFAEAAPHTDLGAARAEGFDDLVAPPTFAIVIQDRALQQLLAEPGTGIVLHRLVHAEQRFDYTRPIVAGDELTARLSVTAMRSMGSATMLTARTAITDTDGAPVVTSTSVLLVGEEDA